MKLQHVWKNRHLKDNFPRLKYLVSSIVKFSHHRFHKKNFVSTTETIKIVHNRPNVICIGFYAIKMFKKIIV